LPYRAFSEFEFAGFDALDDEIAGDAIFLLGGHVAEHRALPIPFAIFRHARIDSIAVG
jgi:hypothetical protein